MPDKLTDNLSNNSPILSNGLTDSEIFEKLEKYKDVSDSDITTTSVETILLKATYLFINRLQAENEELVGNIDRLKAELFYKTEQLEIAKAEAYKEFAERLKAVYADFDEKNERIPYPSLLAAIDCLLIGMVGDSNAE